MGQGNADPSAIISSENNSFIGVVIQYRVSGVSKRLKLHQR